MSSDSGCDRGDTPAGATEIVERQVRSIVSAISSLLERLVFVASAGEHDSAPIHDLALRFGRAEVDRVLDAEHKRAFDAWLNLFIEQQADELTRYLETQASPLQATLRDWVEHKRYRQLVPAGALELERDLFLSDVEAILSFLTDATIRAAFRRPAGGGPVS